MSCSDRSVCVRDLFANPEDWFSRAAAQFIVRSVQNIHFAAKVTQRDAQVICIPAAYDSGNFVAGIQAGLKCRDLLFDESRQSANTRPHELILIIKFITFTGHYNGVVW